MDYWQAWGMWWHGVDLKPMALYGLPMIWVGRIAKVVTYIGGLTILLDLLGPDRVAQFARAQHHKERGTFWFKSTAGFGFVLMCLLTAPFVLLRTFNAWYTAAAVPGMIVMVYAMVAGPFWRFLCLFIESERRQQAFRWLSVVLLGVGFSFDMLTS